MKKHILTIVVIAGLTMLSCAEKEEKKGIPEPPDQEVIDDILNEESDKDDEAVMMKWAEGVQKKIDGITEQIDKLKRQMEEAKLINAKADLSEYKAKIKKLEAEREELEIQLETY